MKKLLILSTLLFCLTFACNADQWVQVEYFGHACFRLTLSDGYQIVIDPFDTERFQYTLPQAANLVLMTHGHSDHSNWKPFKDAAVYMACGEDEKFIEYSPEGEKKPAAGPLKPAQDVIVRTVPSFHDEVHGEKRGCNGIIIVETQGMQFVHLGDIGTTLTEKQITAIGKPDVLMVPVGGKYTVAIAGAYTISEQLQPWLVIPMHFHTSKLPTGLNLQEPDDFYDKFDQIKIIRDWNFLVTPLNLPEEMTIVKMNYHP